MYNAYSEVTGLTITELLASVRGISAELFTCKCLIPVFITGALEYSEPVGVFSFQKGT